MRAVLIPAITKFLGGLRFRNLFLVAATLFVVTLVVPDFIPFADELLFGLATLLLARWKDRDAEAKTSDSSSNPPSDAKTERRDDVIDLPRDQVRREN